MITHQETFLSGGDRFGFSWSTAHYIFKETIAIFNQQMYDFVKFPGVTEQRQIARVCVYLYSLDANFTTSNMGFSGCNSYKFFFLGV